MFVRWSNTFVEKCTELQENERGVKTTQRRGQGSILGSKNVIGVSHLADSLSAEASESVARDSLYVAVLLQFPKQHGDQKSIVLAHFQIVITQLLAIFKPL